MYLILFANFTFAAKFQTFVYVLYKDNMMFFKKNILRFLNIVTM